MLRKIIVIWILLISIIGAGYFAEKALADEEELLPEVMPEAEYFSLKSGDISYYQAFKGKKIFGIIFHTLEVLPEEQGMLGPIDVLVGMDMQGRITGIKILSHQETPGIGSRIELPWFQKQFKGKGLSDQLIIGEDIDAVSGATVSSEAVARIVKESSLVMAGYLGIIKEEEKESPWVSTIRNIRQSRLTGFLLLSILAILGFTFKLGWLRNLTLVAGLVYLGFMKKIYFSFISIFYWPLLVSIVLIMTIIWGRIYCGWICPFGALQEFLNKLPFKVNISPKADRRLKYIKYFLLPIVIAGIFISKNIAFGNYEPFLTAFTFSGSVFLWSFLVLVLLASFFISRPFCRYFCLIGALQALFSRWSLVKLKVKESCNNCQQCARSCPVAAISIDSDKIKINLFECIRCNRCVIMCPHIKF